MKIWKGYIKLYEQKNLNFCFQHIIAIMNENRDPSEERHNIILVDFASFVIISLVQTGQHKIVGLVYKSPAM